MNITERLSIMVGIILNFLPKLVGFLLVLLIGYMIAKMIAGAISKGLQALKLDDRIKESDAGSAAERITKSPTKLISGIAYWALFLGAFALALGVLNIPVLNAFLAGIFAYIPNIIASLLILTAAGAFSAIIVAVVSRTMADTATGKIAATAIPAITMTIAAFMALNQLGIARDIVNITFTALIGSVALGLALAFGLGGRDVASRMLEDAYTKGKEGISTARSDIASAREQVKQSATEQASSEETDTSPAYGGAQPAFGETLTPEDIEDTK